MSDPKSPITLEEFAEDAAHIVEQVASERASVLIEVNRGEFVEVRYVPHHPKTNGAAKSPQSEELPKTVEEKWHRILSVIGSWPDFDDKTFLEENAKSRAINDRPFETL